jgi:hypothetical protein
METNILRQAILEAQDLPSRDELVPEWNVTLRIRGVDAQTASTFSAKMVRLGPDGKPQAVKLDNFMAELAVMTFMDPNTDQPIFTKQDIAALGKKSAKVLKRLTDIAADLSGMSEDAAKAAAKNSETPDADSPVD